MMVGGLFNWGYYASQKWALELFVTTDEVGKFYALTQVAYTPIALAGSLLLSLIAPIIYARVGDPNNHARVVDARLLIFTVAIIGMGATLFTACIAYFVHEWVFQILVAEKYRDYSVYMPLVVLAAGMLQVSLGLSTCVAVQNKTRLFIWNNTVGNSMIIILNLFLTSIYGVSGLVVAMILGSIIHLTWMVRLVRFSANNN
jgi:O-antigen/teichoic acid export membrane protein